MEKTFKVDKAGSVYFRKEDKLTIVDPGLQYEEPTHWYPLLEG